MANPQLEDGYIKIATEIWDQLCALRIPGGVRQIIDCILRKTYGWNKKEDWVSHSQLVKITGMKKGNVSRELSKAITHKLVIQSDNKLSLNKNYEEWISFKTLSKVITGTNNRLSKVITNKPVIQSDTPVIQSDTTVIQLHGNNKHYTKDTITKDIVTKVTTTKVDKRNPDINKILDHLKGKMEIPSLDLSEKSNRQYAYHLLRKSKSGLPGVLWLIDLAASDPWFKNHTTSVRDIWNNKIKIIAVRRGEVNKYVDASNV